MCVCIHGDLQIYNEKRRQFSLVKNQPRQIVEKVASDIEKLLAKKRKALDVSQLMLLPSTQIIVLFEVLSDWFWSLWRAFRFK